VVAVDGERSTIAAMIRLALFSILVAACGGQQPPTPAPTRVPADAVATGDAAAPPALPDATVAAPPPDAWAPASGSPVEEPTQVAAAPTPPALPRADAKGCHDPAATRATETAYAEYVRALTNRALEGRGWTALAAATTGNVLVAQRRSSCGPPGTYAIDRASNVFGYSATIKCAKVTKLKVCSSWGIAGCGIEPPPQDWFVTAPGGARMLAAIPSVVVEVPRCIQIVPTGGFAYPP
jgi:hypothetical protein